MNIFKQFYCRAFQFGFKIAIPMLPYRNPFVLHSVTQVPGYLKKNGCSSVLLVTDRSIRGFGITKHLEDLLRKENIRLTVYDGVTPNPTVSEVEEARGLYLAHKCNALIGFGGGSSMDCAKAVGALIARPDADLEKLGGMLRIWAKTPLTIAVPTTAG
ncbi:MAG: iron-containing alcohol dehydrogenase, partial [Lachnospiraceae bacterium]|nr:iron-containing alcohol dehydrogenase [Lachnospiraceae bacterium]